MDTAQPVTPVSQNLPPQRKRTLSKDVRFALIGLAAVVVLCLGAVAGGAWYFTTTDARTYNRAQDLLEDHRYEEAERVYLSLIEKYPKSPYVSSAKDDLVRLYEEWARDLASNGNYEKAVEILTAAIEDYPYESSLKTTLADIYLDWGKSLAENGNYEKSVLVLETLLDNYPESPRAGDAATLLINVSLECSQARIALGDYPKAVEVLKALRTRFPLASEVEDAYIDVYLQWSKALFSQGSYPESITALETVLDECSNSPRRQEIEDELIATAIAWSRVLADQGSFQESATILENAEKRVPGSSSIQAELPGLYKEWGEALINQGNFEEGIEKLETVTARWPETTAAQEITEQIPNHFLQWGDALSKDIPGSYEQAVEVYSIVLQEYPGSEAARQAKESLINLHINMGKLWAYVAKAASQKSNIENSAIKAAIQSAVAAFEEALILYPDSAEARTWYNLLNYDFGDDYVFVISPGDNLVVTVDVKVMTTIPESGPKITYGGSISPSKVEADIQGVSIVWSSGQSGARTINAIRYSVQIIAPNDTPSRLYRLYLASSIYYSGYRYPKLIERPDANFFVIVLSK